MSVREDILCFLQDTPAFAASVTDGEVWLRGLEDFALPSIAARGDLPLRAAQAVAWRGLAEKRTGLVLGPPGTGKTLLLSWLIAGYLHARRDARMPCRVFVTAFTRNAVAVLLDAVAKRIGTHFARDVPQFYFGSAPPGGMADTIELLDRGGQDRALEAIAHGEIVLGGTIWSLNRLLTTGAVEGADGPTAPLFDLVCIDEASQMVLGHGLMALAGLAPGGRVVVAGDDRQLPPVRASRETKIGERQLGGSLYTFLKSTGAAEYTLDETFRLNAPLTLFPERQFYVGRYRSVVPDAKLTLRPNWAHGLPAWQRAALDPAFPVVALVHEGPPAATSNHLEAGLAVDLVRRLRELTVITEEPCSPEHFWGQIAAIISPHRAQNATIRAGLGEAERDVAFVETVDRIQGKERDVIILSYCVADPEFALAEAEFIFSPERLNVAITRARTKLVVLVSRRLLEAVPAEQEVMDKAECLREFIFSCEPKGDLEIIGPGGVRVAVQVRVRGFPGATDELDLEDEAEALPQSAPAVMTTELEAVLRAVRDLAIRSPYGSTTLKNVKSALARRSEPFSECRDLHRLGRASLQERTGKYGSFWTVRPLSEPRRVFDVTPDTVRVRIGQVVREARRGTLAPFYTAVRERFAWMSEVGSDDLLPVLRDLGDQGLVVLAAAGNGALTIDVPKPAREPLPVDSAPPPELRDVDFAILNVLETIEAKRINFGVFDGWTSSLTLARQTDISTEEVTAAVGRLRVAGYAMLAQDGCIRSRMAELAREIRYVRQRFKSGDAEKRPNLVRSLKLELRERNKPVRAIALAEAWNDARVAGPEHAPFIDGLIESLSGLWGPDAKVAGFQARAFQALLAAWEGQGPDALVIAADTGSGKTEAVILPMIVAAASDSAAGIRGVRAVLTYPRVRLVANQAQRLAQYLASLHRIAEMPRLTLGMQVGQVPRSFDRMGDSSPDRGFECVGPDEYTFPFFPCPECTAPMHILPGGGIDGEDALVCTKGDWRFDGWVGSKSGLAKRPPALFVSTIDSLHQWMHDPRYAALFGDEPGFAPPRALLADEIHLYTHIHGAQVGLTLRRLKARTEANAADGHAMVTVGMSATLGDPAQAWGRLIGRTDVATIRPEPNELEINPRGREYFYFIQPEVESRGRDIAGASTTIQSLMCLAHGMRRRTGAEGGFRTVAFLDSIDKLRRLHGAYLDAEEHRELARLRTKDFGDDEAGEPRQTCCGEPAGCDLFGQGECWWFAANDEAQRTAIGRLPPGSHLQVAEHPVFSGTRGDIEKLMKRADIVFATSSLEVGYDDPDITLVYQHYAPQNLASFIQRKGRGGRGLDDRPITAVTLSIYSPRDSWWFRRPREMISPDGFQIPLNPDNFFARRGQALCIMLDAFARRRGRQKAVFGGDGEPVPEALEEADRLVVEVLGAEVWREFGVESCGDFWRQACGNLSFSDSLRLSELRASLEWAPDLLFDTINLPSLGVMTPDTTESKEDISLLLPTVAPGNATRRFHHLAVHWRPPVDGRAPWLDPADYESASREQLFSDGALLAAALPVEAHEALHDVHPEICRPRTVRLERLGRIFGADWTAEWLCDSDRPQVDRSRGLRDESGIQHGSRGYLRGYLLITARPEAAVPRRCPEIAGWVSEVNGFVSHGVGGGTTGLQAARVYWGADAEVRIDRPGSEPVSFAQTFIDPGTGRALLHGYRVDTEGLRFHLDSQRLNAFVAAELDRFQSDEPCRRWHSAQFMRYLLEVRSQSLGVNAYEARRGADLMVAAAGNPELRKRLQRLLQYWDPSQLADLFHDTWATLLAQHPLISMRRVQRTAATLSTEKFRDLVKTSLAEIKRPEALAAYVRSLVLHGLALRLKQSFIHTGHGDEQRVLAHAKLPVQFNGETDDVITICEAGSGGDGTTRGVLMNFAESLGHWCDGFLADCPNADEDLKIQRFWNTPERHLGWRSLDPNDSEAMQDLAAQLALRGTDSVPASLLRILFDAESIGAERLDLYDLTAEIEVVRKDVESRFGRQLQDWELVSAVVEQAKTGSATSALARLHTAYDKLDDVDPDASLDADARLAEQVNRIGIQLCVDGCRGCVHQTSDLMSDSLVEVTVSRQVLERFLSN